MKKNILYVLLLFSFSCSFTEKVTEAPVAYDLKQYAVAVDLYKKEYAKSSDRRDQGRIAYRIGECYRRMGKPAESTEWFKKGYDALYKGAALKYAYALKYTEDYKEASSMFREAGDEDFDRSLFQNEIQACQAAANWKKNADKTNIKVEAATFNSAKADFSPILYSDGQLVFSSNRPISEGKEKYTWTKESFYDLFSVDPIDGAPVGMGNAINTGYNEAVITFNADFTEAYFTRCGTDNKQSKEDFCQIYHIAKDANGEWSNAELVKLGIDNANVGHPLLTPDGKGLFFSSDKADGFGGYDLYFTYKVNDGWAEALNLGNSVNTQGDEDFPFLDADTLYFASNGQPVGMGGLDIYRSVKREGRWQNVTNMKAPINSGGDDFGFIIDRRSELPKGVTQQGWFASSRIGGLGDDDIYKFQRRVPPPVPVDTTPKVVITYKLILQGYTQGKTTEGDSVRIESLANTEIKVSSDDGVFVLKSNKKGDFEFEAKPEFTYHFEATKDGYFTAVLTFTTPEIIKDEKNPTQTVHVDLTLNRIIPNQEIVLKDIYYNFDKADIREDAKPSLNNLVNILKLNPKIRIELSSHTDCRGNDNYNLALSQRRAESAVQYIIKQGISADRIEAKGYGETEPRATCECKKCKEDEHQENRRTSFKVL